MTESIPVNIARALLPNRRDYVKLSHMYTPLRPDQQEDTRLKYILPQSSSITWTHICPIWKGFGEPYYEMMYENLTNGICITMPIIPSSIESGYYQPFTWPIPPMKLGENTTLTLYVTLQSSPPAPPMPAAIPFSLKLLGFEDILPESVPQYILYDGEMSSWSFIKDESTQTYRLLTPIELNTSTAVYLHSVTIPKSSDLIISGMP
jgi:hypothetical protein